MSNQDMNFHLGLLVYAIVIGSITGYVVVST